MRSRNGCSMISQSAYSFWSTTRRAQVGSRHCVLYRPTKWSCSASFRKSGVLETKDGLLRRIDEASRHVDPVRLGVSPQCGFASVEAGNPITPAQ
jgi:hypothetical protein